MVHNVRTILKFRYFDLQNDHKAQAILKKQYKKKNDTFDFVVPDFKMQAICPNEEA